MKTYVLILIIALLPCLAESGRAADETRLTPEAGRITDEAISFDIAAITGLQKRLADINTQGVAIGAYHFAKAQAWIDMALDEYSMNDRTAVIEDTVRQAHALISQLENKKSDISMETPILPTSRLLRPDLWQKAAEWKKHPGFHCGEDLVAQLEVQLVWSGHEDNQLGWRHAKPYLQGAERLAREAGLKIENCPAQPVSSVVRLTVEGDTGPVACAPAPAVCPSCPACLSLPAVAAVAVAAEGKSPPAEPVPAKTPEADIVSDRIHFALNRDIISPRSAAVLQRIAAVLLAHPEAKVELQGNADERGNGTFNNVLSRQRAEVIRTYLVSAGVQRSRISVRAFGMTAPVMRGNDILSYARNRRVEFDFSGSTAIKALPQYEDVQVEKVKK